MKYIIVVDKQPRTNPSKEKRETAIDIEELRRKGDVHDDFLIEQGIAKVWRRIGITKYNVTYVLENEIIENLGELKIKLFKGTNYIYVKDEYNNQMCVEFVIDNEFNNRYITNLQMESAIEETASQIKLYVGQILEGYSDTEKTQAMINLKADEIRQDVSKIYATQDALEQEKSERTQTANSIVETVSETYSTKSETNQAKTEAINSANTSTDNKLKDYSTTEQMGDAIKENADTLTEELSSKIEQKASEVSTSVTESTTSTILTLLNNGYLTAEQVNALVNGNAKDIATVKEQLKQTITSSQMRIEITKAIERWS